MIDKEGYTALWVAIYDAAEKLAGRCQVYLSKKPNPKYRICQRLSAPAIETWQMVEALSLLMILIRADAVHCKDVVNIRIFSLAGFLGPM